MIFKSYKGLRETQHPFAFVAQAGFRDLLETHDADEKAIAVLPKLVLPIKNAMVNFRNNTFNLYKLQTNLSK